MFVKPISTTSVRAPADMIAVCDSRLVSFLPDNSGGVSTYPGPPGTIWAAVDFAVVGIKPGSWGLVVNPERHGRNYNLVFCDAHVEGLDPSRAFDVTRSAIRWNNDHQPHPETW
jgi:prepilin-type processing-associated H-X9-DG protein